MKPIDRDKLELHLSKIGGLCRGLSFVLASDAGAVNEWMEETMADKPDEELLRQLRRMASDAGYLARRLAGLCGSYSRKPRQKRRRR